MKNKVYKLIGKQIDLYQYIDGLMPDDDDLIDFYKRFDTKEEKIEIFIFEKCFAKINSKLSLTIIAETNKDGMELTLLSGGGMINKEINDEIEEAKLIESIKESVSRLGFIEENENDAIL